MFSTKSVTPLRLHFQQEGFSVVPFVGIYLFAIDVHEAHRSAGAASLCLLLLLSDARCAIGSNVCAILRRPREQLPCGLVLRWRRRYPQTLPLLRLQVICK